MNPTKMWSANDKLCRQEQRKNRAVQ